MLKSIDKELSFGYNINTLRNKCSYKNTSINYKTNERGNNFMKKMKIVNMRKFVRSMFILLGILIAIILFFPKATLSHNEKEYISYETISVAKGDTLWSIANYQQKNNPYYTEKDIRDIISELKKVNQLTNTNLQVGQALKVPVL